MDYAGWCCGGVLPAGAVVGSAGWCCGGVLPVVLLAIQPAVLVIVLLAVLCVVQ